MYRIHRPTVRPRRDTHPELPIDPDAAQPGVFRAPHFSPRFLALVFAGGLCGTAARYGVTNLLPPGAHGFPVATLFINLLGAFLLGLLLEGLVRLGPDGGVRRVLRLTLGTGFMGGFTTFSTLALDADTMLRSSDYVMGTCYVLTSVAGGIALSTLGIWVAASHHRYRERRQ